LVSVLIHGLSPAFLIKAPPAESEPAAPAQEPAQPVAAETEPPQYCSLYGNECSAGELNDPEYITLDAVKALQSSSAQLVIVDARTERTYDDSGEQIPGAVRLSPHQSIRSAGHAQLAKQAVLAILCA
jgi:hypothetical protein